MIIIIIIITIIIIIMCLFKPLAVKLLNYRFVSRVHIIIINTNNNDLDNV